MMQRIAQRASKQHADKQAENLLKELKKIQKQ